MHVMIWLHLIHLAATAGYCALLWLVQVVVYPQMAGVSAAEFPGYHARHTRAITRVVAPLFLLEGGGAVATFLIFRNVIPELQWASMLLFGANTALTFFWFVPAHRALAVRVKDEALLRRLVSMNRWRAVLSTWRLAVVMAGCASVTGGWNHPSPG